MDELNEVDDSLAFTTEDELELLRGSALAIALATIKFLRERGIAIDDWARSLSASFAKGWDTVRAMVAGGISRCGIAQY